MARLFVPLTMARCRKCGWTLDNEGIPLEHVPLICVGCGRHATVDLVGLSAAGARANVPPMDQELRRDEAMSEARLRLGRDGEAQRFLASLAAVVEAEACPRARVRLNLQAALGPEAARQDEGQVESYVNDTAEFDLDARHARLLRELVASMNAASKERLAKALRGALDQIETEG